MVIYKDLDANRIYVNKRKLVRTKTLNNKIKTENNIENLQTENQSNSEIKQDKKKKKQCFMCQKTKHKNVVGNLRVAFIFKNFCVIFVISPSCENDRLPKKFNVILSNTKYKLLG